MSGGGWAGSLRGRLLRRGVLTAAVPLAIMLVLLWVFLGGVQQRTDAAIDDARESLARDVVAQNLLSDAENLGRRLDDFLLERLLDVRTWVQAPALEAAIQESVPLGEPYRDQPVEAIEAAFPADVPRALLQDGPAVAFLAGRIEESPHFGEAILADADGLVVVATSQPSDFVQSDEDWWQGAWNGGTWVSDFRFDESAGVFSLDLAVRVGSPAAPLGVIKTVLAVSLVQELADEAAELAPDVDVVVADHRGLLLAETATGHADDRILQADVTVAELEAHQLLEDLGTDSVVSPAIAAGRVRLEGSTGPDGVMLDSGWTVLLAQPSVSALAPLAPITDLRSDVSTAVSDLLGWSVVVSLVGLLLAGATAFVVAGQVSRPLTQLRDAAAALSEGEVDVDIPVSGDDELGEIGRSLRSLAWAAKYVTSGERAG